MCSKHTRVKDCWNRSKKEYAKKKPKKRKKKQKPQRDPKKKRDQTKARKEDREETTNHKKTKNTPLWHNMKEPNSKAKGFSSLKEAHHLHNKLCWGGDFPFVA